MGNCCITSKNGTKAKSVVAKTKKTKLVKNGKEQMSNVSTSIMASSKVSSPSHQKKLCEEESRDFSSHKQSKQHDNNILEMDTQASVQISQFDEQKAIELFTKYKDKTTDHILEIGTENLCNDLELDPTEFRVLLLAWKFNVSQMCRFTKDEFLYGCKTLQVDSISSLKHKLIEIEQEVDDKEKFKDLYRFTYGFGLDTEDGQRTLPTPVAIDLWRLVFSKDSPVFINEWFNFLEEKQVKGISRDTWSMFLYLLETVEPDFSNYDDSEAWPSLFDEFVEKKKQVEQESY